MPGEYSQSREEKDLLTFEALQPIRRIVAEYYLAWRDQEKKALVWKEAASVRSDEIYERIIRDKNIKDFIGDPYNHERLQNVKHEIEREVTEVVKRFDNLQSDEILKGK